MKSVVLDSNELARDFMCVSLRYQLLEHAWDPMWVKVYVPKVVLEETVANYARELEGVVDPWTLPKSAQGRLGLHIMGPLGRDQYREYLEERFDHRLGFTVMDLPEVSHEELVRRAVTRTPPFDRKGRGYRDSLIWANVKELAQEGDDVVLVTEDGIFTALDGTLVEPLAKEIETLPGTVTVAPRLAPWLMEALPWPADDLVDAVKAAQDEQLNESLVQGDALSEMEPEISDLGFRRSPYDVVIDEVCWEGTLTRVSTAPGPGGLYVAEYDLDHTVSVRAMFNAIDVQHEHWAALPEDPRGQVTLVGEVPMVLRMAVLFGGDVSLSIEEVDWRRTDGTGQGEDLYRPERDPTQLRLFEPPIDAQAVTPACIWRPLLVPDSRSWT